MAAGKFETSQLPSNKLQHLTIDIRGSTGPTERWAHVCASWQVFALKWFVARNISTRNMYMYLQIHNMCAVCCSICHACTQSWLACLKRACVFLLALIKYGIWNHVHTQKLRFVSYPSDTCTGWAGKRNIIGKASAFGQPTIIHCVPVETMLK